MIERRVIVDTAQVHHRLLPRKVQASDSSKPCSMVEYSNTGLHARNASGGDGAARECGFFPASSSRSRQFSSTLAALAFVALFATGCSSSQFGRDQSRSPDAFERFKSLDLFVRSSGSPQSFEESDQRPAQSYRPQSYIRTPVAIVAGEPKIIRSSEDAHLVAEELRSKLLGAQDRARQ
jgi:hypothetical protein